VDGLLTRPRFSTRRCDALFVRVEAACPDTLQTPPSRSPVGIFADAVKSESKSDLWNQVKAAAAFASDDRSLPAILSDDTINFLSLASTDPKERLALGIPDPTPTISTSSSPVFDTFLSPKPMETVSRSVNHHSAPTPPNPSCYHRLWFGHYRRLQRRIQNRQCLSYEPRYADTIHLISDFLKRTYCPECHGGQFAHNGSYSPLFNDARSSPRCC
jgi:hypothetical protein